MQTALKAIFWVSVLLLAYNYVVYPLVIYVLSRVFGRRDVPADPADESLPSVSLLIAAHNEEDVISERIQNSLALDYPRDRLEIVIASDGSTDGTNEIVEQFADRGVTLIAFAQNRGKSTVLNDSIKRVRGEIVMLSDANTMMDRHAVRRLARWFQDPAIGAVCGKLELYDAQGSRNADGFYWKYENLMKRCEGYLGGVLGANGAIYAIRSSVYQPIPSDTLVDDFTIPLLARLRTGCGIAYDRDAIAFEETAPDIHAEFRRRARIGAGGFQALARLWPLMHPRFGWTAFTFFSHKVLRWLSPFFLVAILLSNILLAYNPLYGLLLAAQVVFYAMALVGNRWSLPGKVGRVLRLPTLFTAVNAALAVGFGRWLLHQQTGTWTRTRRLPIPPVHAL